MVRSTLGVTLAAAAGFYCGACARTPPAPQSAAPRLIPAARTMVAAWEVPRNPLTDPALDHSKLSEEVRRGFRIFTNTPVEAPRFVPGGMSCANCHMNAGQREKSLPLVDIAGVFPEYNRRSGRLFSLNDRIVDCFLRSENAAGAIDGERELPNAASGEVLAVAAYLAWLSKGSEMGKAPAWRGRNVIEPDNLLPVDKIDAAQGRALFGERCTNCHGADGQGVMIGDKKAGPLWGPRSWNDGAGAARVYTLAGMIRYAMPYLDPGSLTDQEAMEIAAFIDSQPRPSYPAKDDDYRAEKLPADAVYYKR